MICREPNAAGFGGTDEVSHQKIHLDGVPKVRSMSGSLEDHELAARLLGECDAARDRG